MLMTRHFDYCPSASKGDNQSVGSSAPVVSRCFPGGYNVKLYISRGRLAWWLLAFLHSELSDGWNVLGRKLVPLMMYMNPAPDKLLKMIHCNCSSSCVTTKCSCRRYGLECEHFLVKIGPMSLKSLESSKVGCYINKQCMNHLFYADDAVLLAPTVDALQKLIDVCQDFARKGDMVYNFEKSECTTFIPNTLGHIHTPNAYLGDKKLKWVDQKRYLGVLIRSDCSDNEDIARQKQKVYSSGNMLTTYFKHCGEDVKLKLFKTYCYSMHGTHLWSKYTKTGYDRIRIAFDDDIFRNLLGIKRGDSISAAFVNARMDNFNMLRRKSVYSFIVRLSKSTNAVVTSILRSVYFVHGSHLLDEWKETLLRTQQ